MEVENPLYCLERKLAFQVAIFRFHVSFRECKSSSPIKGLGNDFD